jgi:hypothetical protein
MPWINENELNELRAAATAGTDAGAPEPAQPSEKDHQAAIDAAQGTQDPSDGTAPEGTDQPTQASSDGQLLSAAGTSDLVRVRTGEGDDAQVKVGRIMVGAGGALTFQEIERGDDE